MKTYQGRAANHPAAWVKRWARRIPAAVVFCAVAGWALQLVR